MIASRVEKSTRSSARLASSAAFASCDCWTFASRLSSEDASNTVGAVIATSRTTAAIRPSALISFRRVVRRPACKAIAAPAAIRNHPA